MGTKERTRGHLLLLLIEDYHCALAFSLVLMFRTYVPPHFEQESQSDWSAINYGSDCWLRFWSSPLLLILLTVAANNLTYLCVH